jgi:hypothetical protein
MIFVPDSFDLDSEEVAMILATKLYEQGKLSLGQAAELIGSTKKTFEELLGNCGVSILRLQTMFINLLCVNWISINRSK